MTERLRKDERASLRRSLGGVTLHLATLAASVASGVRLGVSHELTGWRIAAISTHRFHHDRGGRTLAEGLTLPQAVAWLDNFTGDTPP